MQPAPTINKPDHQTANLATGSKPKTCEASMISNQDTSDSSHCPSCGSEYVEHLGLIGICRENVELRRQVANLRRDLVAAFERIAAAHEILARRAERL